jgi:hypothetical protein
MRFDLEAVALEDTPAALKNLDQLLGRVIDEVHRIVVLDADAMERSTWFNGLRSDMRELVRATVLASAFSSTAQGLRVGRDVSLEGAVRLAYRPLVIAVENKENDGLLVEVALLTYGSAETIRLWRARPPTGRAIDLVHGGGTGDLKREVERVIKDANDAGVPVRAVVVSDSDSRWPGEIGAKAAEIEQTCLDGNVPYVILSCRSAENYLPDATFQQWANEPDNVNAAPQVEALLRLTPDQRDHFPMKGKKATAKGIPAVEKSDAPSRQRELFASVPPEDRRVLIGFHDHIISLFRSHLAAPSSAALDARDRRGDLRRLVSTVETGL